MCARKSNIAIQTGPPASSLGTFLDSFFTTNPFPTALRSFGQGGCNAILVNTLAEDIVGLSPVTADNGPGATDVIDFAPKVVAAAGLARASLYSASRGLVKPMSSSIYRGLRAQAIASSRAVEEAAPAATILAVGVHALWNASSAAYNGECY